LITREKLNYLLAYLVEISAKLYEYLSCNAFTFADEAEQDVFCANVVMAKL
jgi:hypothetical protein